MLPRTIRSRAWAAALAAGALALVAGLAGCGDGARAPSAEEAAPFRAALERHLAEKNMEMEVVAFESLAVEGQTATAKARLRDKAGLYGLSVTWAVTFRKAAPPAGGAEGAPAAPPRWEVAGIER